MSLKASRDSGEPDAIQIRGLRKEYPHGEGVHGLDLCIPRGCTFGLLGPNGAGKSTTIKMLMGLLVPTGGEAIVNGYSILKDPERIRECVGYVPERHYIYPWMTIAEVVWFTRAFYSSWNHDLCEDLLRHYDLNPRKKVKELSHGMTTKLALVLALSHDPEILLLDEPTTGLDPLIREEFLDGIKHLIQKRPRTVLFSSHILSDIERVADRIGIINKGQLLFCSPRDELMAGTRRLTIALQEGHGETVAPEGTVYEELSEGHWHLTVCGFCEGTLRELERTNDVKHYEVAEISLEEIFKDFVKGTRQ